MTQIPAAKGRLPEVIQLGTKRISLLDWKASNVRLSYLMMLLVFALLAGLAYLLAMVFDPAYAGIFVGAALLIAGTQNIVAYWFSDQIALNIAGARPANKEEHRYLVNITDAVAIGAGVPSPKLYVIDSPAPNAFATGRDPERGVIAVTTGLINLMDRQELEAVIAHEMAHIRNYDVRLMSILAATVGAVIILRDVIMRSMRYGSRRRGGGGQGGQVHAVAYLVLILLLVLAPILATLLHLAVSRRREFLADASAAYITRNPEGLASALEKLRGYKGQPLQVSEGIHHMFISHPLSKFNAANAFATHPPLEDRIQRLRQM